jgi:hypothetical protein
MNLESQILLIYKTGGTICNVCCVCDYGWEKNKKIKPNRQTKSSQKKIEP